MTPGTLSPAYVELNYHSAYGQHKALLPTKEWFPTSITGHLGSYEGWNATPIDAEVMIQEYADKIMDFFPTSSGVDNATIWTQATPTSPAFPRVSFSIVAVGTVATPNWSKAVQHQYILRGADFSLMKLVLLDCPIGGGWDHVTDPSVAAEIVALIAAVTADGNAWSTRKNAQPFSFVKLTYKLNDKLRKDYDMD